ncbi:RNA helicase [Candidatus Woesearchaeota archaeon]|nr:MAG: RNA helicase [Candidatus Woesearchaeota archaeon]
MELENNLSGFRKLGLSEETIKALSEKGYIEPTEIQEKAIPLLLKKEKDILGQSQTGTGKTASFALPIIEKVKGGKGVKALILTPTRELAVQITKEFESFSKKLKTITVYGGAPIMRQIEKLEAGVDIVVGTPGRVIDLIKQKKLIITNIDYCVLDEADEMLNMGFVEDIELILKKTPKDKQMMLFSATMPKEILKIAKNFMKDYETIKVKKAEITVDLIDQIYYDINSRDRFEALRRIVDATKDFHGIIFCKTRVDVNELSAKLLNANYPAGALHGEITQSEREKILDQFKKRKLTILIATDVAARGIDVNDLTHVVNYSLPQSPELYVHRIGRTGRAGKKGVAITFLVPSERRKLRLLERVNNCTLEKRELPKISDVLEMKKIHLEEKLAKLINDKTGKFDDLAKTLLAKDDALNVVSSLLDHSFGFKKDSYKEIGQVSDEPIQEGNARDRRNRDRSRRFGNRRNRDSKNNTGNNRKGDSRKNKDSNNKPKGQSNGRRNESRGQGGKNRRRR